MKELRKCVFAEMYKYVQGHVDIMQQTRKNIDEMIKELKDTGHINNSKVRIDDDNLHLIQAEINKSLNQKFDEADERMRGNTKKKLFGIF